MMDLLYDEISEENNKDLQEHLNQCSACRQEVAELRDSTEMLGAWPDKTPKVKMVFTEEKKKSAFTKKVGQYLRYPIAAAAVFLIVLSLANFEISRENGEFHLSMGLTKNNSVEMSNQYVTFEDIKKLQNENILLTSRLVEEKTNEQNADNYRLMSQLAKGIEDQRQNDIDAILTSFTRYQQSNNERLYQTNQNFLDLLQYSSSVELKRDNIGN